MSTIQCTKTQGENALMPQNGVVPFQNETLNCTVRAVVKDGEPWFVAKDVCDALGYGNSREALSKHVRDRWKNTVTIRDGITGNPEKTIINEAGLFALVMKSKMPKAVEFQDWVCEEVLPSIRKHGAYVTEVKLEEMLADPDTMILTLQALKTEREKRKALEAKAAEDAPYTHFGRCVEVSDDHALVTQTFKGAALGLAARGGSPGTVDTSHAYVWTQLQTYAATINANAGVNIPLAAGAPTDTASVNRAYALGMAHTVMMHQARAYWLASSCTATNGVTINHVVPGIYCDARLGGNGRTSLTMQTTGVIGASNYSKILGYSIPVRNSGDSPGSWFKIALLIGAGGEWTEYPDAGMDDYRFRPVGGSVPAIARLVEVTLYYQDGYKARVRELIGIGNPRSYVVRTTESSLNYDSNTGLSSAGYRLIIAQSEQSYTDALAASVWLVLGGAANDTVIKLADIRGWDTYHVSSGPVLYLDVQAGEYDGLVQLESPTILNGVGNNTYVRYGLEPYQRSWITTETETPYTAPKQSAE